MVQKNSLEAAKSAFNKEPVVEQEDDGTFMIGAHFPQRNRREFRQGLVNSGKNVKEFLAEALDDCLEKHGCNRTFGGKP